MNIAYNFPANHKFAELLFFWLKNEKIRRWEQINTGEGFCLYNHFNNLSWFSNFWFYRHFQLHWVRMTWNYNWEPINKTSEQKIIPHRTFLFLLNNKSKTVRQDFVAWTENFHNETRSWQQMADILWEDQREIVCCCWRGSHQLSRENQPWLTVNLVEDLTGGKRWFDLDLQCFTDLKKIFSNVNDSWNKFITKLISLTTTFGGFGSIKTCRKCPSLFFVENGRTSSRWAVTTLPDSLSSNWAWNIIEKSYHT